jgi:hypothetical protein
MVKFDLKNNKGLYCLTLNDSEEFLFENKSECWEKIYSIVGSLDFEKDKIELNGIRMKRMQMLVLYFQLFE